MTLTDRTEIKLIEALRTAIADNLPFHMVVSGSPLIDTAEIRIRTARPTSLVGLHYYLYQFIKAAVALLPKEYTSIHLLEIAPGHVIFWDCKNV